MGFLPIKVSRFKDPGALEGKYNVIVVDPPWDVTTLNGQPQKYPTMSIDAIKALDIKSIANKPSVIFIWTVNKFVPETYDICKAWGFKPSSLLTWCKEPRGMGLGGPFSNTTEFILFGKRGTWESRRICQTSWFRWPRREQSVKPNEFYHLIERHFPGPYIDVFARRYRRGWTVWGNELQGIEIK